MANMDQVFISSASSEGSGEHEHMHSLTRGFTACTPSTDIEEDSDQNLDIYPLWIRQHEHLYILIGNASKLMGVHEKKERLISAFDITGLWYIVFPISWKLALKKPA